MTELAEWGWFLVIVGGPIILGAGIAYGWLRSRNRSRREQQMSEDATAEFYRREKD